ncbi:MAG: FecR domain-containing protein [Armatimonadetes bacterium]|nr:FecR domain-containing protein [Armatimonadota bacterium]
MTSDRAKVVDAFGTVRKRIGDERAKWENINVGDLLPPMTTVKTEARSAVLLLLPDRHVFRIGAKTTVVLREVGKDRSFSFNVLSGQVWSFVQGAAKPAKYEVETPSAVVGVSGTLFSVFYDEENDETLVSADEGEVMVRQGQRTLRCPKGFCARLRRNQIQQALALAHDQRVRQIWGLVRRHEGWMKARDGALRLNRRIEERLWLRHVPPRRPPARRGPRPPR